jgi:sensor c-di-GMP phosphodiesterase-like protein
MMRILERRILVTLATIFVAAACGVLGTLLLESIILIKSAENKVEQDATNILGLMDGFLDESRSLLTTMNASGYSSCSDAESAYLRKLLFQSQYLRDAGHMHDGGIKCSVVLGKTGLPDTKFEPVVTFANGMKVYNGFSPYYPHQETVFGLQLLDSFVILDPGFLKRADLITPNRAATVTDPQTHKTIHPGRNLPSVNGVIDYANWQGPVGTRLFATRCSIRYPGCVTTYASIPEILSAKRRLLRVCAAIGGLTGGFVGFLFLPLLWRTRSIVSQLRRAIRRDKLRLVYQPIVNLQNRQIVGAEALLRWTTDDGLVVAPDIFIPIAEERGLMGEITALVVRHALRDFGETLRSRPGFWLCINVAATDLADPGFLPTLEQTLEWSAVSPQSLAIEVTESSTANHTVASETIRRLRQNGHRVHIDDFGTGYSSLSYLHELSIDAIKIDRSFTQAIGTEAVTVSVLPQILAMAEALKLEVVVEGVETELQADYFCGSSQPMFGQGWLFGRPVPVDLFHQVLADEGHKVAVPADAA